LRTTCAMRLPRKQNNAPNNLLVLVSHAVRIKISSKFHRYSVLTYPIGEPPPSNLNQLRADSKLWQPPSVAQQSYGHKVLK